MRHFLPLLLAATLLTGAACSRVDVNTPTNDPDTGMAHPFSTPAPTSTNTLDAPGEQTVAFDTTRRPGWLENRIQTLLAAKRQNPIKQVFRYRYRNQTVYFETAGCCDQPSTLYDTLGNVLCQPDGGLTGKGDGNCPDFAKRRTGEMLVWQDPR